MLRPAFRGRFKFGAMGVVVLLGGGLLRCEVSLIEIVFGLFPAGGHFRIDRSACAAFFGLCIGGVCMDFALEHPLFRCCFAFSFLFWSFLGGRGFLRCDISRYRMRNSAIVCVDPCCYFCISEQAFRLRICSVSVLVPLYGGLFVVLSLLIGVRRLAGRNRGVRTFSSVLYSSTAATSSFPIASAFLSGWPIR